MTRPASTDCRFHETIDPVVDFAAGRSLCLGPDWSCADAGVVFDRNSGDYWVVSTLAFEALACLQASGPASVAELERRMSPLQEHADLHFVLDQSLRSLAENGLIRGLP